ncbi:hypothetical protein BDF21DRAFT_406922 [Thamnidium elegans]|uniref:Uncharacterized protein n=1 Tax=Thamnidium elegans TaxID=101142 RepID=A0A8H7SNM2_9FUNG|nr:hypothetical protein INT48_005059 [Thamnidium elegans]KAI8095878.1 hypothetical protein BDF21DRAFT_406922 [Thamnidium elegans]
MPQSPSNAHRKWLYEQFYPGNVIGPPSRPAIALRREDLQVITTLFERGIKNKIKFGLNYNIEKLIEKSMCESLEVYQDLDSILAYGNIIQALRALLYHIRYFTAENERKGTYFEGMEAAELSKHYELDKVGFRVRNILEAKGSGGFVILQVYTCSRLKEYTDTNWQEVIQDIRSNSLYNEVNDIYFHTNWIQLFSRLSVPVLNILNSYGNE